MYLAHRAPELFPGASFAVAHCNFRLRGDESDGDEAFVRAFCKKAGLECFVNSFDTADYAAANGISTEMAARDLRYAWFAELCGAKGFDAVAVAHNADDIAETLLLNLVRGTGTKGLRGMEADVTDGRSVRILRPLLGVSREDIRSWMTSQNFAWREDSSNASAEYKRNRIRSEVLPVLKDLNPALLETLRSDMEHISQVDDIAEEYFHSSGIQDFPVSISGLLQLTHWRYVLYLLMEPYGFSSETVGKLTALLAADDGRTVSGKTFEAPDWVAVTTGDNIIISPRSKEAGASDASTVNTRVFARSEGFNPVREEGTLVADADKLPLPLRIRGWQAGDWMVPLGMKGRKKLSDLFVDLKWNILQKQSALVVEHPDGVPGHVAALLFARIDDDLKVTASTKNILEIS